MGPPALGRLGSKAENLPVTFHGEKVNVCRYKVSYSCPSPPQSLYDDGAETTRRQLLANCLTLQIASDETLDRLLEVWQRVVKRVYHYYQMAAQAYFTFLKLNAQVSETTVCSRGFLGLRRGQMSVLQCSQWLREAGES